MHGANTHSTSRAYTYHVIYVGFNQLVTHRLIIDISISCQRSESTKSKNKYSQLVLEDWFGDLDGEILRSY